MLERTRITSRSWKALLGVLLGACVATPPPAPVPAAPPPAPVVIAPPAPPAPVVDTAAEEARAMLAQAETDIQRARAKRALWQKAWDDLLVARQAVADKDHARAIRHARRASELAQLGLEQLAYPAVR
ncbi:MAG TPA: hypothetical protein VM073_05120 [Usitatibacter sp.]|nr:hypothetical protein [Usitatibacter sp.]